MLSRTFLDRTHDAALSPTHVASSDSLNCGRLRSAFPWFLSCLPREVSYAAGATFGVPTRVPKAVVTARRYVSIRAFQILIFDEIRSFFMGDTRIMSDVQQQCRGTAGY